MFQRVHKRLAPFTVALALIVGTSGMLILGQATAAQAHGSPNIAVDVQGQGRGIGLAQVGIEGCNFHNDVPVWFGVHDVLSTNVNAWYGGWITTGDYSDPLAAHVDYWPGLVNQCSGSYPNFGKVVNVPTTSCGDPMRADATDSDGTPVITVHFTLKCLSSPTIGITQVPSSQSDIIGNGQVELTGGGAVPSRTNRIWVGIHDTTRPGDYHGGWISSDSSGTFHVTTTDIPLTSCGHRFTASVADNASTPAKASNTVSFNLFCGPQLAPTNQHGYTGHGFAPGSTVVVHIHDRNDPNTDSAIVVKITASPNESILSLRGRVLLPGGKISGTLPTCDPYTLVGYQLGPTSQVISTLPLTIGGCP